MQNLNRPRLVALQFIFGAMFAGTALFAGFASVLARGKTADPTVELVLAAVLASTALMAPIAHRIVRSAHLARVRREAAGQAIQSDDPRVLGVLFTERLIAGAFAEGIGFLGAIGTLVTGNFYFLAGTGVGLLALIVLFPRSSAPDRLAAEISGVVER